MDRPLLATPAKDSISSTQTTASDACHSSSGRHLGSASTASGSSHSEYCGDHTLLVSRNAAITRNANWANRGRRAADSPSQPIPTQASRNSARDRMFTKVGTSEPAVASQIFERVRVAKMKYQESYSGGRSEFSRMNSYQPCG